MPDLKLLSQIAKHFRDFEEEEGRQRELASAAEDRNAQVKEKKKMHQGMVDDIEKLEAENQALQDAGDGIVASSS